MVLLVISIVFFFFKQKTAYEMRISDWSSDVCSSDLAGDRLFDKGGQLLAQFQCQFGRTYVLKEYGEFVPAQPCDRIDLAQVRTQAAGDRRQRQRSEERRVGKECVRTCRSRWSPDH